MTNPKNMTADPAGPAEKKKKPDEVDPISHQEQEKRLDAALDVAQASGLPSAAAFRAMWKFSCVMHASGMFRDAKSPAGCFVKIAFGNEIGLTPMQSMVNIDIIDGVPAMPGQLMASKFEEAGGVIEILERSDTVCRLRLGYRGRLEDFSWTVQDVNRAGLKGKDNHSKYPRAMLYWRTISEGVKVIAPGALLKAYTYGELTEDRAQDLAGYLTMPEGVPENEVPAQGTQQRQEGQQRPPSTGSGLASATKMSYLYDLMKSPACPAPLVADYRKWIQDHASGCPDGAITKMIEHIKNFSWKGSADHQPTDKQLNLLAKLAKSAAVSDDITQEIDYRVTQWMSNKDAKIFGKFQCGAWISCCQWLIDNRDRLTKEATDEKPGDSGDASPGDDKATDQNSIDDQLQKQTDEKSAELEAEFKKREAPNRKSWAAVADFIDQRGKTLLEIETWMATVLSWQVKEGDK